MKKNQPNSIKIRNLLIFSIVLIIGLSVFGFYTAKNKLTEYANTVGELVGKSSSSNGNNVNNIKAAKDIKKVLEDSQATINKANLISSTVNDYQTQSAADINKYADLTGITITDYNFDKPTDSGSSVGTSAGSSSSYINVTLSNPISYDSFIKFIKYTEHNLPKMQLVSIDITKENTNSNQINTKTLTFKVYTE